MNSTLSISLLDSKPSLRVIATGSKCILAHSAVASAVQLERLLALLFVCVMPSQPLFGFESMTASESAAVVGMAEDKCAILCLVPEGGGSCKAKDDYPAEKAGEIKTCTGRTYVCGNSGPPANLPILGYPCDHVGATFKYVAEHKKNDSCKENQKSIDTQCDLNTGSYCKLAKEKECYNFENKPPGMKFTCIVCVSRPTGNTEVIGEREIAESTSDYCP